MWFDDDSEPAESGGFAEYLEQFLIAAFVGIILGAVFFVAAVSIGSRVPGLIG